MAAVHPGVVMTKEKIADLRGVIKTHYRDRLVLDDLGDPQFLGEVRGALDALSQALDLPNLYDFQRDAA
jgi:succinylarginine dihydrolase